MLCNKLKIEWDFYMKFSFSNFRPVSKILTFLFRKLIPVLVVVLT